jgi:hypothetical protein
VGLNEIPGLHRDRATDHLNDRRVEVYQTKVSVYWPRLQGWFDAQLALIRKKP